MKKRFLLMLFLLKSIVFYGQIHEIGIMGGGSNYIGDIGSTNFVYPVHNTLGVIYKWNKSTRHSYRFSLINSIISGNDLRSDLEYKRQRNFGFINVIREVSAGIEFNFFDFNLHQDDFKMTPYVSTGFSLFAYDNKYYIDKEASLYETNILGYSIPMIIGAKAMISRRFILGLEVGARYTFTDNLDGTNPNIDNLSYIKTGNEKSNDWYVFSLITLTYTFGKNPCYCPL